MKQIAANIAKRLQHHDRFCRIHTHEGFCSCGRDEAVREFVQLLENQQPTAYIEPTVTQIKRRLAVGARYIVPKEQP